MGLRVRLAAVAAGLTLFGTVLGLTLTYVGLLSLRIYGLDEENVLLANLITEAVLAREDESVRVPGVISSYLAGERGSIAAELTRGASVILTDREIRIAIQRRLIVLDPAPRPDAYSSTSVDLTLDRSARMFRREVAAGRRIDPAARGFRFSEAVDESTEPVAIRPRFSLRRGGALLSLAWTRE